MSKGALKRFQFHQSRIAFHLRKLIQLVINDEGGSDSNSSKDEGFKANEEQEKWPDDIDYDTDELDNLFTFNISHLPYGVNISGITYMNKLMLNDLIQSGYSMTPDIVFKIMTDLVVINGDMDQFYHVVHSHLPKDKKKKLKKELMNTNPNSIVGRKNEYDMVFDEVIDCINKNVNFMFDQ
jgi:hypothetical protein